MTGQNQDMERTVIQLIATDRIDIPISSMAGKLKRTKPKIAQSLGLEPGESYQGDRVYVECDARDRMKARGMKAGIEKFGQEFPRHRKILEGYIEEQRALSETHVVFGVNPECRLTADDYTQVMSDLGFSETTARNLYPELMEVSRNLSRRQSRTGEQRSVMIGSQDKE